MSTTTTRCPACDGTGEHCHLGECTALCDTCGGRKVVNVVDFSADPLPYHEPHIFKAPTLKELQEQLERSRNINAELSKEVHQADEARHDMWIELRKVKQSMPMEHVRQVRRAEQKMRHWQGNHRNVVAENERLRRLLKDVAGMSSVDIAAGKVEELLQQATREPTGVPKYPVGGKGTDWRFRHATASEKALETKLVQGAIHELCQNLGVRYGEGLPYYGITKVATYAAQVARAQALSMDPEDLRI